MPAPETPTPADRRWLGYGRRAVVYWLVAGAIYVALGVWHPPVFLLGFQESLIFVFLATLVFPLVMRRRRR